MQINLQVFHEKAVLQSVVSKKGQLVTLTQSSCPFCVRTPSYQYRTNTVPTSYQYRTNLEPTTGDNRLNGRDRNRKTYIDIMICLQK